MTSGGTLYLVATAFDIIGKTLLKMSEWDIF